MGCKQIGANRHYVWPEAEVAVMKAEGAVAVLSHNELLQLRGEEKKQYLEKKLSEYQKNYMNSKLVLQKHFVDEEIRPEKTREILYRDLLHLSGDIISFPIVKKHSNAPV